MHGYQVPLFPANPLTKHSFQFNEDNTARRMAPASWVFLGKGQRGGKWCLSEQKYSHQPSQAWTERHYADPVWASGPSLTWSETQGVISLCWGHNLFTHQMPEYQALRLCVTLQCVYVPWSHLYLSGFPSLFFTKSLGIRACSATCLSEPRRLYLRCSYICFASTIVILATVSISEHGISAKIFLWVYVVIFSEGTCYFYLSTVGTTLSTLRKVWNSRKHHAMWCLRRLIFT